ncbi:hypothetical protein DSAG12_03202 [Promethearchaeum syntrophicum]|uniref:Uncharacterized protein n=1 Tax=Promethearchaeum syntrophicum TaxID=2594042 RepID=A0A5B9DDH9_9ARCH|nr:hypothetical protein [Candidatus Prometheoarchaeum syntrophicum]QEE17369.1 Ribosomal RNA small subunit methyltransferase Nep1 [Candidatus Prometheoarchaeum syntrophicum]
MMTNPRMHIILTETALELIPKSLKKKPSTMKSIEKFGRAGQILDTSLHHSNMHTLENSQKRGRPDILHHFLLDTLGSPANIKGFLEIYFHCASGFYKVNSEMKCPRDYIRFKGLMFQLIRKGHIPPNQQPYLISRMDIDLKDWIKNNFNRKNTFIFSLNGKEASLETITSKFFNEANKCAVLIGGFQKNHFSDDILEIPSQMFALADRGYDSWIVTNRLLAKFELDLKLI